MSTAHRLLRHLTTPFFITKTKFTPAMDSIRTMTSLSVPRIKVSPQLGLIDDDLHIRVEGLASGQKVTLQTFLSDHGLKFISCGQYCADFGGEVDCKRDKSLGGNYEGVEEAGLIWSMVQAPGQREGLRLMKRNAALPYDVHLLVHDGHHDFETCYERQNSDSYLAKTFFNRTHKHPDVTRTPVRTGRLRGALYTPPGPGPFPVVLDLFGTAGGLIETRAALLASRGFLTLALAYFAYEDLPKGLDILDMDYFEEAVEYLIALPNSINKGIGVVGVSKGGEIALQMAELMPKVSAVVSINGLYFRSTTRMKYKNEELPMAVPDYSNTKMIDDALYLVYCFDDIIEEKCIIKAEKSDAKFLLIASEDDGQCPPFLTEMTAERLTKAGKGQNLQFHLARGAGHLLEPPHTPFCKASYHSKFGCNFLWGGEKVAHTRAQEVAWPKILDFLHESLDGGVKNNIKSKL